MYKSVYDLSPAEMEELRQSYFYQLQNESPEILQGITDPIAAFLLWMMIFSVIRRVEKWGLYFCLCFRLC